MGSEFDLLSYIDRHISSTSLVYETEDCEKQNQYECCLCSTERLGCTEWKQHLNEQKHKDKLQLIVDWKKTIRTIAERQLELPKWKARLVNLGCPKWQDKVKMKLYEYCIEGDDDDKNELTQLLERYELAEQMVVLDLAIWKVKCQFPHLMQFSAMDWYWWMLEGWKQGKMENRASRDIDIVLTHVFPFLNEHGVL